MLVNYWLCVTNEENWDVVRKKKVWGVPRANKRLIESVKRGDLLVFYVSPKSIRGIFEAVSEPYEDDKRIFSSGKFGKSEIFPHRVKVKPVAIAKKPLPFDDLIPKLKFITNKKMWTGHLRRAMRRIPEEDYKLILDCIR